MCIIQHHLSLLIALLNYYGLLNAITLESTLSPTSNFLVENTVIASEENAGRFRGK